MIGVKPGHGAKSDDVHSQTSPIICSAPEADALAGYAPTGAGRSPAPPRLARSGPGGSDPHGQARREARTALRSRKLDPARRRGRAAAAGAPAVRAGPAAAAAGPSAAPPPVP